MLPALYLPSEGTSFNADATVPSQTKFEMAL